MTTERNWLIRTTQNQILGPVAKAKVLEFLQKGALGLNDEVTSGNGFWFSLKEKDLVEKYLYGDVPQGYNPISESKSVLSKREHPDRTTSLNTAPANKTQVLKAPTDGPSVLPKNEDLEYPDIALISTTQASSTAAAPAAPNDEVKLPNQEDLEFPDITMVARPSTPSIGGHDGMQVHTEAPRPVEIKSRPEEIHSAMAAHVSDEPVVYPKDDDLEFPDMGGPATKVVEEEELNFAVDVPGPKVEAKVEPKPAPKKPGMQELKNEIGDDSNLTLMFDTLSHDNAHAPAKPEPKPEPKHEKIETLSLTKKSSHGHAAASVQQAQPAHHQPEKLLHERKVKASAQPKEVTKDQPKPELDRSMPEHLKKRNDNYLLYLLIIIVLIILGLFFYYYRNILNKPLPV